MTGDTFMTGKTQGGFAGYNFWFRCSFVLSFYFKWYLLYPRFLC